MIMKNYVNILVLTLSIIWSACSNGATLKAQEKNMYDIRILSQGKKGENRLGSTNYVNSNKNKFKRFISPEYHNKLDCSIHEKVYEALDILIKGTHAYLTDDSNTGIGKDAFVDAEFENSLKSILEYGILCIKFEKGKIYKKCRSLCSTNENNLQNEIISYRRDVNDVKNKGNTLKYIKKRNICQFFKLSKTTLQGKASCHILCAMYANPTTVLASIIIGLPLGILTKKIIDRYRGKYFQKIISKYLKNSNYSKEQCRELLKKLKEFRTQTYNIVQNHKKKFSKKSLKDILIGKIDCSRTEWGELAKQIKRIKTTNTNTNTDTNPEIKTMLNEPAEQDDKGKKNNPIKKTISTNANTDTKSVKSNTSLSTYVGGNCYDGNGNGNGLLPPADSDCIIM